MVYDEFNDAPEDYFEPTSPDRYFSEAQKAVRALYEVDRESVYYIRQLQVKFEKQYFHWVTNNAVVGLYQIGFLKEIRIPKEKGTSTRFFIHKANRYARRSVKKIEKIIEEYSRDEVTRGCGYRAEDLFCVALAMRGCEPVARKVKEHNGKRWEKSGHDLDFVFRKGDSEYGCEIKNTLGYIERDELEIKLEMCEFFGIKPLFIMRYSPKSYNRLIIERGGYALIFETQIYELGQEQLVKKMKEELGLPVICSKAIPDSVIDRFVRWHEGQNV